MTILTPSETDGIILALDRREKIEHVAARYGISRQRAWREYKKKPAIIAARLAGMPTVGQAEHTGEVKCPYWGIAYRKVPDYVSGYGCPVCKGIGASHLYVIAAEAQNE